MAREIEGQSGIGVVETEICIKEIDVSAKSLDFPMSEVEKEDSSSSVESLYLYKNSMNLIPTSVGSLKNLKTLKFFRNDLNLFPAEVNELVKLECLQVRAGSGPDLRGLEIEKIDCLKDLELSRAPMKLSGMPLLNEIAGLKDLKKLSVCHFDIRYVPPEIECLTSLEHLNLSFNKINNLPVEITKLSSLLCLDVSCNKQLKGWKRRLQQRLERSSRKRKVQNNTADFQNSVSSVQGESTLKKQKNVDAFDDDETQKNDETLKKENVAVIDNGETQKKSVGDGDEEEERCSVVFQTKRHYDSEPDDNPKARNSCRKRQMGSETEISHKYRRTS